MPWVRYLDCRISILDELEVNTSMCGTQLIVLFTFVLEKNVCGFPEVLKFLLDSS